MGGRLLLVAALAAVVGGVHRERRAARRTASSTASRTTPGSSSARGSSTSGSTTLKRLGVPLVRFTVHWDVVAPKRPADPDVAARPRLRLAALRPRAARHPPARADAGGDAARDARRGRTAARRRTTRRCGRATSVPSRSAAAAALPVGSLLADLERAEPPAVAEADEGVDLRRACAQPRLRGDPCGAAACARRRRRDRAARRARRRRAGHVASRHGPRARQARRVRPQSVPAAAGRDAVGPRLSLLPERSRWRRCRSS